MTTTSWYAIIGKSGVLLITIEVHDTEQPAEHENVSIRCTWFCSKAQAYPAIISLQPPDRVYKEMMETCFSQTHHLPTHSEDRMRVFNGTIAKLVAASFIDHIFLRSQKKHVFDLRILNDALPNKLTLKSSLLPPFAEPGQRAAYVAIPYVDDQDRSFVAIVDSQRQASIVLSYPWMAAPMVEHAQTCFFHLPVFHEDRPDHEDVPTLIDGALAYLIITVYVMNLAEHMATDMFNRPAMDDDPIVN